MLRFLQFYLMEDSLNRTGQFITTKIPNTAFGNYYEALVADRIHRAVQSSKGTPIGDKEDPFNVEKHKQNLGSYKSVIEKAKKAAESSADNYLNFLQKKESEGGRGIKLSDIESVHHTNKGIQSVTGNPEHNRRDNPHDILFKLKNGKFLGASLKGGRETLSQTTFNQIKIGNTSLKDSNKNKFEDSATEHSEIFNKQKDDIKRNHLRELFKGNPSVELDRVGIKNREAFAEKNSESHHIRQINDPKNQFNMKHVGNGVIHVTYKPKKSENWLPLGRIHHRGDQNKHRIDVKLLKKLKPESSKPKITKSTNLKTILNKPKLSKSKPANSFGSVDHGHVIINPLQ